MAMKWVLLDGKKDPPFEENMLIMLESTNHWAEVYLKKIETLSTGKAYTFTRSSDPDIEFTSASHYMLVEPPKNNQ